jgi:hypothetical protein
VVVLVVCSDIEVVVVSTMLHLPPLLRPLVTPVQIVGRRMDREHSPVDD